MRKKIVAGNWKMNKAPGEAVQFINSIKDKMKNDYTDVVFCVPSVCLFSALEAAKGSSVMIGAQNMHFEDSGAYTGEISAKMLVDMGIKHVILGHSERRAYFGETNEIVNKKVLKAIENGLTPFFCVGETIEEREQGITIDLIRLQVKVGLQNVTAEQAKNVVIAYEPVWAIGTGKTATSAQAEEVCAQIRKVVSEIYSKDVSDVIRIQYGGSVTAANAKELFTAGNIDGGLVGGASLKPEFAEIVNHQ